MTQTKTPAALLRHIREIEKALDFLDSLPLADLVVKYNVDHYVKKLPTRDVLKIAILFFYSKERYLKHFLVALLSNGLCCRLFRVNKVTFQQVYKAIQHRCWFFFYEAFHQAVKLVFRREVPAHRLFQGKEIKIMDSTFLTYALSRLFIAKFGYCSSEKCYKPGIKLHTLLNYSREQVESFLETGGNTHDSRVADTLLKDSRDCVLLIDKGYQNLERFLELTSRNVTFIIPLKQNLKMQVLDEKVLSYETGDVVIRIVELKNGLRVLHIDCDGFAVLCNDCSLQWYEVIALYSFRWEIELVFKQLKQAWHINDPLFRNYNSIMAFICITLTAVVILQELAKQLGGRLVETHHIIGRKIEACLVPAE